MEIEQSEIIRNIINHVSKEYDFEELNETKDSSNKSEEIQIKTIKKGVYGSIDKVLGIFCKFIDYSILKPELANLLKNRKKIDKYYKGEKYFLCYCSKKIYSYKIEHFETMNSIINEIDMDLPINQIDYSIGISESGDLHALILETGIADFAISGMLPQNQEEEERVILSKKLADSQPFFEFKAPINFDWSKLIGDKDAQFERICELLLQKEKNITGIIPIGKTRASDRGRDFEVIETIEGFNSKSEFKWLVQCKYSTSSISPSTISGWTDRIIEHKYDGFWLMTNNDLTPNLFDQFKDVENNEKYNIKIKYWQRSDFNIKMNVHSELFMKNDIFDLE